ncbi:MAG: hypothetical protein M3O82_06105, partial [Verrucomicrobiota bacterium]|nr:hypothetical protein [Verrucomicrobiota bacterium]
MLLLIFHRPLLIAAIRIAAVKIAAKQNVQLTLRVEGSVLRDLRLEDLFAIPIPGKVSPVEKIHIGMIQLRYSLIGGLRHGFGEFLRSYELKDAQIILRPVAGTRSQKQELSSTLQDLLQQPALFSDRVFIEQLSVIVHSSDGDLSIKNANLSLDPAAPGYLRIDEISIPNFHTWRKLDAVTTFKNRDLVMTNLALDDELQIHTLELDASRRTEKIHRLAMEGTVFGAPLSLGLFVDSKEENKPLTNINLAAHDLSLARLAAYLHPGQPMFGEAKNVSLRLKGDPNVPSTWTGDATVLATGIKVGTTTFDKATLEATAAGGVASITAADLSTGKNTAHVSARIDLPPHIDELSAPDASGEVRVSVTEPALIDPSFTNGVVAFSGPFTLKDRKFALKVAGTAADFEARQLTLKGADFQVEIVKTIPPAGEKDAPFFKNLTSNIVLSLRELRFDRYAIDAATVRVNSHEQKVQIEEINVARGDNSLAAHGDYLLPADLKSWTRTDFHLLAAAHAPRIAD